MTRACGMCGAPVAPRDQNQAWPFCSERCRLIDLGKWLGEEYRVPTQEPEAVEDESGDERPKV